ncbi:MAG: hypothetical protein ABIS07_02670 [Dokdonella sp.]
MNNESVPLIDPMAAEQEIDALKIRVALLEGQMSVLAVALAALARSSGGAPAVTTAVDRILDGEIDGQHVRDLIEANRTTPMQSEG